MANSIHKNFAYNVVYQIFTVLMPLITAPYLARVIGANGVGIYSYTFTVAEYFVYFALLGVNNYGNRTIAAADEKDRSKTFVDIYAVQATVSLIVFAAYMCFAFGLNEKYTLVTKLQALYVLSAGADVTWYFFGTEKFKVTTMRNIIVKLAALVCIFVFVREADDVWKYTLIMALSYLLSQLVMWIHIVREVRFEKPSPTQMRKHFTSLLILFVPVIAITLYKMMDKIMLEIMGSVEEVGYYESAEKIVRVPALLITALGTAMLPRMSKLSVSGKKEKMLEYFGLSCDFSGFMSFSTAFGISAVAAVLIPIYYGDGFEGSIPMLQLLCFSLLFTSWASILRTQYLLPLKKDKEYIASVFLGAVVNLILNALLIPKLQGVGAVLATIAAEASVAIVQTVALKNELRMGVYLSGYCKYLLPSLVMYAVVWGLLKLMPSNLLTLCVAVMAGMIVYFALFIPLGRFCKSLLYTRAKGILKAKLAKK